MLKEIIGRIVEAETTAEKIEKEAYEKAENIRAEANATAQQLRLAPSDDINAEVVQILSDANLRAEDLTKQIQPIDDFCSIPPQRLDRVAQTICEQFLKRGL